MTKINSSQIIKEGDADESLYIRKRYLNVLIGIVYKYIVYLGG